MNQELIATKQASVEFGIHPLKILNRSEILKIKPQIINNKNYWTYDQIQDITNYQTPKKIRKGSSNYYAPIKIKIIELFLYQKNNSCVEIAKQTNLQLSYINKIINEYIKTKHIVVESKINL